MKHFQGQFTRTEQFDPLKLNVLDPSAHSLETSGHVDFNRTADSFLKTGDGRPPLLVKRNVERKKKRQIDQIQNRSNSLNNNIRQRSYGEDSSFPPTPKKENADFQRAFTQGSDTGYYVYKRPEHKTLPSTTAEDRESIFQTVGPPPVNLRKELDKMEKQNKQLKVKVGQLEHEVHKRDELLAKYLEGTIQEGRLQEKHIMNTYKSRIFELEAVAKQAQLSRDETIAQLHNTVIAELRAEVEVLEAECHRLRVIADTKVTEGVILDHFKDYPLESNRRRNSLLKATKSERERGTESIPEWVAERQEFIYHIVELEKTVVSLQNFGSGMAQKAEEMQSNISHLSTDKHQLQVKLNEFAKAKHKYALQIKKLQKNLQSKKMNVQIEKGKEDLPPPQITVKEDSKNKVSQDNREEQFTVIKEQKEVIQKQRKDLAQNQLELEVVKGLLRSSYEDQMKHILQEYQVAGSQIQQNAELESVLKQSFPVQVLDQQFFEMCQDFRPLSLEDQFQLKLKVQTQWNRASIVNMWNIDQLKQVADLNSCELQFLHYIAKRDSNSASFVSVDYFKQNAQQIEQSKDSLQKAQKLVEELSLSAAEQALLAQCGDSAFVDKVTFKQVLKEKLGHERFEPLLELLVQDNTPPQTQVVDLGAFKKLMDSSVYNVGNMLLKLTQKLKAKNQTLKDALASIVFNQQVKLQGQLSSIELVREADFRAIISDLLDLKPGCFTDNQLQALCNKLRLSSKAAPDLLVLLKLDHLMLK